MFFQEKSQSYIKNSRQPNIPKIPGQSITELKIPGQSIINHLKKRAAKQLKLPAKGARKCKANKLSMPSQNPAEN